MGNEKVLIIFRRIDPETVTTHISRGGMWLSGTPNDALDNVIAKLQETYVLSEEQVYVINKELATGPSITVNAEVL
jgi:hypothetical protein